jgi:two-component system, OmpR family, phosphate regulon sensor histidine kinase PhoR
LVLLRGQMKNSRYWLFPFISVLALALLLLIQVQWMKETRAVKEKMFEEKSAIVLARTIEAVSKDSLLSRQINIAAGPEQRAVIDSLFKVQTKYYNFPVNFTFDVVRPSSPKVLEAVGLPSSDTVACYDASMDEHDATHSWTLTFNVPDKESYLQDELRLPILFSVVLVLIVLLLFIRTVRILLLEKRIAAQTTALMNNMTHEFKTPITNISLAGKMLLRESSSATPEKVDQLTRVMLEENERLNKQVDQVLSMSALESKVLSPEMERIDIHALIVDTLRRFSLQIESKQGEVLTDLNAGESILDGDALMLSNAIGNLIDNAIKYAKENPQILIRTFNEGSTIIVEVSDKGIGIEKEFHDQVFVNYFRVPTGDVHNVKGFGLGLAYVRKVVELHRGHIAVESEPGQGTCFTIKLPTIEK